MLIRFLFLFGFLISASLANDNGELAFLVKKQSPDSPNVPFIPLICTPIKSQIGLGEQLHDQVDHQQDQRSSSENLSDATASKLIKTDDLKVNDQSNTDASKKEIDLHSTNEHAVKQAKEKIDQLINTESKMNENKAESNETSQSTNEKIDIQDADVDVRNEDSTAPPTLRESPSTESNDTDSQSNDNKSSEQLSIQNVGSDADLDSANKTGPILTRAILPQTADNLNSRQTTGIMGSLLGNLHPSNIINSFNGKNRPDASLPLVQDEKTLEQSFKQSLTEQAKEQKQSVGDKSNTAAAVAATVVGAAEDTKAKVENNQVNLASLENAKETANKQSDNNQDTPASSSTASSSTTSTTTNSPVSEKSEEQIQQEKIFEEFFGSRGAPSSFQSILEKLGFSSSKNVPPAVLKEKLQAEFPEMRSNQPSILPQLAVPAPVHPAEIVPAPIQPAIVSAPVQPAAIVPAPPTNQQYLATPLPILPTVEQSNYKGIAGNPSYLSYDEYNKNLNLMNSKYLPPTKPAYNQVKPNINYAAKPVIKPVYDQAKPSTDYAAKPVAKPAYDQAKPATDYAAKPEAYVDDKKNDYTTIDKLKGNVNGPVEVPALKDYKDVPKKPIKIKDYVENDQASYRTNDFRLSNLTPFNRVPAFSRYSKVVSSASNGLSRLYPGYKAEKNEMFPIYGMYRN